MSKTIEAQIRALAGKAHSAVALADKEERDLTSEEKAMVTATLTEAKTLHTALENAKKEAPETPDDFMTQINGLMGVGNSRTSAVTRKRRVKTSAGMRLLDSEAYKLALTNRGANPDAPWHKRHVNIDGIDAPGLLIPRGSNIRNALVTGSSPELQGDDFGADSTAGLLVSPDGPTMLPTTYARELKVRDLLTTVPTTTDTIDYVKVDTVTNNAAAVPEATSSAAPTAPGGAGALVRNAGGGYKPESALTFTEQREHVRTIAHTMPVTKKALADAPQIRTIIDTFLRYGLDEKIEDLILTGNGTGENFLGLLHASREESAPGAGDGVQVYESGEDLLVKSRRAKTKSRLARGGLPTAYLMHPLTAEEYFLTRDGEDRFRAGGPFADTEPPLWGLPIVQSEAMTEGEVVVGNFRQGVYYDREQATLSATDSHEDFFIRNLVMILAEVRGGFAVLHPSTFVKFNVESDSV